MDYQTAIALALGAAGLAGSFALYRLARNAPAGYEDEGGFHYGDPSAPGRQIDWDKPLEFVDDMGNVVPAVIVEPITAHGTVRIEENSRGRAGTWWCDRTTGEVLGLSTYVRNRAAIEPPVAANSNVPQLTDTQRAVLLWMHPEIGYSASRISDWTGLPIGRVRAAQRELFQLGLANFGTLFSDEDGKLRGRGYWLTDAGDALRCQLREGRAA
jgi:hypothetical protein